MAPETMKAWQYTTLSSTLKLEDALTLSTIPAPTPSSLSKNQLLISVISASLNPADYKLYETGGLISKLAVCVPGIPGIDFCGRILATHPNSTTPEFKPNDLVFGCVLTPTHQGSLSQTMIIPTTSCIHLPPSISPLLAAAAPTCGLTALLSLPSSLVHPGVKVFINAGSGGTGTWGIQIAKAMGVFVVTSCSTGNIELCKSLGADEVIDYKVDNLVDVLAAKGPIFDLVVDNVGVPPNLYEQSQRFLKPGGTFTQVALKQGFGPLLKVARRMYLPRLLGGGERKFRFVAVGQSREGLERLAGLMVEGKVRPVVEKVFEFEEVKEAFGALRGGRTRGKIVVNVGGEVE